MKPIVFSRAHFGRHRRGMAMLYFVGSIAVLVGFCSLAVDLGRVQTARTDLRRAADAAARAAVANLARGNAAVQDAAYTIATNEKPDGVSINIDRMADVQFIAWTAPGKYTVESNATDPGVNAVRVFCRRTEGTGNAVPLLFGQVLGVKTCDATVSSMAMFSTRPDQTDILIVE
jgi:Flp pilus assembly protein TadG